MDLHDFLKSSSEYLKAGPTKVSPILVFVGKESPVMLDKLVGRICNNIRYTTVMQENELFALREAGQRNLFSLGSEQAPVNSEKSIAWYWFSDISGLYEGDTSATAPLITTLFARLIAAQSSVNRYCCALSQRDYDMQKKVWAVPGIQTILVPDFCNAELVQTICLFYANRAPDAQLIQKITRAGISLNALLMLLDYIPLVNRRKWDDLLEYATQLAVPTIQIRELSEFFWNRDVKKFFATWELIADQYPEQYWVWYWSNQLLYAANFIERSTRDKTTKPMGQEHGLSPSFTWKAGYKKYSPAYCAQLHAHLIQIDFELKNGSTGDALEHFFWKHFLPA